MLSEKIFKGQIGGKSMNLIDELLQRNKKLHFSLIDPDKQSPEKAGDIAHSCAEFGTNAIMVGGSTVLNRKLVHDTIETIKEKVEVPIILFPNSSESISENVEHILFMMLLNSKDSRYLGKEQAKGALLVKKWNIKPISTGYIVINTSKKLTTIEQRVKLDIIHRDNIEKAVNYALYAEMSDFSCVYFDAGSGAEKPISNEMIKAIRTNINIPIIVGGGIRDEDTAKEKIDAGADIIVNGTVVEDNLRKIEEIIKKIRMN
ncbi:geranylgeranylglyceryl/heptaprenylglyceryl phosphate synthase [Candidatus Woesearchaeota archaeon]|nr:geranylgeranylglyceryl/heptaprenylglyceryl phosphate synthase [Candidatus Woesearchaeota archaeon]